MALIGCRERRGVSPPVCAAPAGSRRAAHRREQITATWYKAVASTPWGQGSVMSEGVEQSVTLSRLQQVIRDLYGAKDSRRGVEGTFMWFMEEVGELSAALRGGTGEERAAEFADVLAWLA